MEEVPVVEAAADPELAETATSSEPAETAAAAETIESTTAEVSAEPATIEIWHPFRHRQVRRPARPQRQGQAQGQGRFQRPAQIAPEAPAGALGRFSAGCSGSGESESAPAAGTSPPSQFRWHPERRHARTGSAISRKRTPIAGHAVATARLRANGHPPKSRANASPIPIHPSPSCLN